jgi:hypothetical protein
MNNSEYIVYVEQYVDGGMLIMDLRDSGVARHFLRGMPASREDP